MARLVVERPDLVLRLSWWERVAARTGGVRVPLATVRSVTVEPDWWRALRGTRGRGLWIPGVCCVGSRHGPAGEEFTALTPGRGTAVCVGLAPVRAPFSRIAVSARAADAVAAAVTAALGQRAAAPADPGDPRDPADPTDPADPADPGGPGRTA